MDIPSTPLPATARPARPAGDSRAAQAAFAAACLDPDLSAPAGIAVAVAGAGERARRFAVHRNNVVASLTDVLAANFPAVRSLVGEEFFRAAAGVFVRAHPPATPVMARYGDGFADFLAAFPPAAGVPCLADVARLEMLVLEAFHAADAVPLAPADLSGLAPEAAGRLRLALHPAARRMRSRWPVTALWEMNTGRRPLAEPASWEGEEVLVSRPRWRVEVTALPPGAPTFLDAAASRAASLAEAAEAALRTAGADLAPILHTLLAAGALVRRDAPSEETPS